MKVLIDTPQSQTSESWSDCRDLVVKPNLLFTQEQTVGKEKDKINNHNTIPLRIFIEVNDHKTTLRIFQINIFADL